MRTPNCNLLVVVALLILGPWEARGLGQGPRAGGRPRESRLLDSRWMEDRLDGYAGDEIRLSSYLEPPPHQTVFAPADGTRSVPATLDENRHERLLGAEAVVLEPDPARPGAPPEPLYEELTPPAGASRLSGLVDWWDVGCVVRGYFLNDQRIEWSGTECTFGAEAAVAPVFKRRFGGWETTVEGEFYLNQPFDRNILADTPERRSYLGNCQVDTFEISQLRIAVATGDFTLVAGKMVTPFGRVHFPLYSNARLDAPFIRTESILWRETGLLLRYAPGVLTADVALTNGGDDRDANSSKALVSRIGIDAECAAVGVSVKLHDGIGSEGQKVYNNHLGMDCMVRRGRFICSAELIYDEYGFRRPGFDPNDITWCRSIYYRDLNYRLGVPITGVGYYVDLGYQGDRWSCFLNYGEFYPQSIGHPQHDIVNRRGIVKLDYRFTPSLSVYAACLVENAGYLAQDNRVRRGGVVLAGLQWTP